MEIASLSLLCKCLHLFVVFYTTLINLFWAFPLMLQSELVLRSGKAQHISKCLQLAILLEVSADKPGNVNFVVGFEGTRVEHFLASAVVAAPSFKEAAKSGIAVSNRNLRLSEVGIGKIIKDCVADIDAWQRGGNTLLGTVMLFVPLAVAGGMTPG